MRDVHEVYMLRIILEGEAAALATPKIATTTLDALSELMESISQAQLEDADEQQRLTYVDANTRFHLTIARETDNTRLARFIASLMEEASRYVFIESEAVGKRGIEETLRVLEAMYERNPEKARREMVDHIQNTYRRVADAIITGNNSWLHLQPGVF
jgi:DNA-binding GntR family transcriptional regulator